MNERVIIVGEDKTRYEKENKHAYYAHWANDSVIYSGWTPEEAIASLLAEKYPTIWHLNDTNPIAETVIETEKGTLGVCKPYYNRKEAHEVGETEGNK